MSRYLRKVTKEDCDLLFEWANDSETRKNSFATEKIRKEEHIKWFERLLEDTHRAQYIYMDDEEPIGQVRIDIYDSVAEISYSICSAKRGIGHGKNLLKLLYNQVFCDFPEVKKLIGKVKSENIASQKVFLDVGYAETYKAFEMEINEPVTITEHTFLKKRGGYFF